MKAKIKRILARLLYPLRRLMGRFIIIEDVTQGLFYKAGKFVAGAKINGDYIEFGVYSGSSFALAFHSIQRAFKHSYTPSIWNTEQDCIERRKLWEKMRFIAFDSFQGLPEPAGVDSLSKDFVEGKFANSKERFESYLVSQRVPLNRARTVPGWFAETLNEETIKKHELKHAAIVHIDSDLYESARLALNFVKPLLVDGTVIIFDD